MLKITTREERETWQEIILKDKQVCGECRAGLVMPWSPELNTLIVVCSADRSHTSFSRRKSLTEQWHQGEPLPIELINILERQEEKRRKAWSVNS